MKSFLTAVALVVLTAGPAHAVASQLGPPIVSDWPVPVDPPTLPATVPEPATLGLLAGGVVLLAAVARSRQKKG